MNALESSELLVTACINAACFHKSDLPNLKWVPHFPIKLCCPNVILCGTSNKDLTDRGLGQQAKAVFNFDATIAVEKPPCQQKAQGRGHLVQS